MQYVGQTAQQLNIRFATHKASMSRKLKSNSCKWLAEHFSTGICKNAKYSVQIIEKWQGSGRTSHGAIDLGEAILRRKRETEWILKLRTVYPYGLNKKVDICDDDKNVKRFKSDGGIVGKLFPSLRRLFERDQICRHVNGKGINILNYKQFITNLNNYLKDDLPNALNYIRVSLASIKKETFKTNC